MSGVTFEAFVVPVPEDAERRPSGAELGALIEELVSTRWLSPDPRCFVTPADAKERLIASAPEVPAIVSLDGGANDDSPRDWPANQRILSPELVDSITLVSSPFSVTFPGDLNGGSLGCTACQQDILSLIRDSAEHLANSDNPPPGIHPLVLDGFVPFPQDCPACGAHLVPGAMVLRYSERSFIAPAFRFALRIRPLHAPDNAEMSLPDDLLQCVGRICGLKLRQVGRETY